MFFAKKICSTGQKKAILSITIIKLDKKYENNYWVPIKNNKYYKSIHKKTSLVSQRWLVTINLKSNTMKKSRNKVNAFNYICKIF